MAGRTAQVLVANAIQKIVEGLRKRCPDMHYQYGLIGERTVVVHFIGPCFRNLGISERHDLVDELLFRLEGETGGIVNWLVHLYAPEDEQAIKQRLQGDWERPLQRLSNHQRALICLAEAVDC